MWSWVGRGENFLVDTEQDFLVTGHREIFLVAIGQVLNVYPTATTAPFGIHSPNHKDNLSTSRTTSSLHILDDKPYKYKIRNGSFLISPFRIFINTFSTPR